MKRNDIIEIGINMTILIDAILNKNSSAESVANTGISFAQSMLTKYPELRQFVDDVICSYDKEDEDFNEKWDRQIAWIDWEKRMLK